MNKEQFLKKAWDLSLDEIIPLISELREIRDVKLRDEKDKDLENAKNNAQIFLRDLEWVIKFDHRGDCLIEALTNNLDYECRIQEIKEAFGLYSCSAVQLPDYKTQVEGCSTPTIVKGPMLCLNDHNYGINLQFQTPKLAYDYVKCMGLTVVADTEDIQRQLQRAQRLLDLALAWNNGKPI